MPKKLRWLRSPTGSNGRPWKNWRLSRNRIRCWPGTESSSPTSSTDRSFANPGVVPELTRKPSGWRSEEHTSELQSRLHLVCRLLLEKKKNDTCPLGQEMPGCCVILLEGGRAA